MATEKQIEANKANAQRSTGPKTVAGKAKASQNSRKHGIRARRFYLLEWEDPREWRDLAESYMAELAPLGPHQESLVMEMLQSLLNIDRCHRLEAAILASGWQNPAFNILKMICPATIPFEEKELPFKDRLAALRQFMDKWQDR
jgi:hypothetical protein